MLNPHPASPPAAGDDGHLVIKRRAGEAVDIATAAGLDVRVQVLAVDNDRVQLLFIGPKEVRFHTRTRQEADKNAKRRRA